MLNKPKDILFLIIFCLSLGFINLFQQNISYAQQNKPPANDPVNLRTCYAPAVTISNPDKNLEDLNNQLKNLETQYKEKKINSKTYKKSKENLLNELKKLNNDK